MYAENGYRPWSLINTANSTKRTERYKVQTRRAFMTEEHVFENIVPYHSRPYIFRATLRVDLLIKY